jgi:toxin FitB
MIILDTNVLSELMKPKPSSRVLAWVATQPATELCTTSITEAEIYYGIELLARGKRREGLLAAVEAMFAEDLAGRVFGFESEAARVFSKIAAARRAHGRPISHADAQIAAIARVRQAKLATRNVADFENCGLDVVDPWNGRNGRDLSSERRHL